MAFLARLLASLPLLIISPLIVAISACALALADLLWRVWGRFPTCPPPQAQGLAGRETPPHAPPVIIPNLNRRHPPAQYLPHLQPAPAHHPYHEILRLDHRPTRTTPDHAP